MRSRSLLWSFNYAIEGIVHAFRTQRNMRLHLLAATVTLITALFLRITNLEFLALVFAIATVLVAELVNTAIETTVDIATEGFDPLAKVAKDVAAGAVLVASVTAVIVGYVVFFKRLTDVSSTLFIRVGQTPVHVTVIALLLTSIAVVVTKALTRNRTAAGTFTSGGWPSGHTAAAVCVASGLAYYTESSVVLIGGLFLAALVAQSRVEGGIHTIPQVVLGAVYGFLIATGVFQVLLG